MTSSRGSKVSCLMFKSITHFEFIFVYGERLHFWETDLGKHWYDFCQNICLMTSSRSSKMSCLMFKSITHLSLFLCMVRGCVCSNFIGLHAVFQHFNTAKETVFSTLIFNEGGKNTLSIVCMQVYF